jgi:hypothetical protein
VFTLPAEVADIAFHNKALVYDLLFRTASETMMTIAADPKHLGARIGITAVLHTWGSAMTYHPHVHMIVPGGGIALRRDALDLVAAGLPAAGARAWRSVPPSVPGPVDGASRCRQARLLRHHDPLADRRAFLRHLSPVRKKRWVVYAKPPFAGPAAVLAYLSRYTHRVAISNRRLLAFDETGVTFQYKDYRRSGADRQQVMTLAPTSSSAASCSTSCRAGSTASATTACSPVAHARTTSNKRASCSRSRRPPPSTCGRQKSKSP